MADNLDHSRPEEEIKNPVTLSFCSLYSDSRLYPKMNPSPREEKRVRDSPQLSLVEVTQTASPKKRLGGLRKEW